MFLRNLIGCTNAPMEMLIIIISFQKVFSLAPQCEANEESMQTSATLTRIMNKLRDALQINQG